MRRFCLNTSKNIVGIHSVFQEILQSSYKNIAFDSEEKQYQEENYYGNKKK